MSFMEQGVALLGAGRFHEALQQFAQALRQQPLAIEPRIGLAQACQDLAGVLRPNNSCAARWN